MKNFILQIFTWWNGQTLGTRLFTWRKGERVGVDGFGNIYYRSRGGEKSIALGRERRWVVYKGETDPSQVPAGWHGWLHHRVNVLPDQENYTPYSWELPHQANPTGSRLAIRPQGSILKQDPADQKGSYEPWVP